MLLTAPASPGTADCGGASARSPPRRPPPQNERPPPRAHGKQATQARTQPSLERVKLICPRPLQGTDSSWHLRSRFLQRHHAGHPGKGTVTPTVSACRRVPLCHAGGTRCVSLLSRTRTWGETQPVPFVVLAPLISSTHLALHTEHSPEGGQLRTHSLGVPTSGVSPGQRSHPTDPRAYTGNP